MVDYELNELKREFLDEARQKVGEMEAVAHDLQTNESVDRLAYLAHQLKGSGGSYGFQSISEHAAEIERASESIAGSDGERHLWEDKIRDSLDRLRDSIEQGTSELQ